MIAVVLDTVEGRQADVDAMVQHVTQAVTDMEG